LNVASESNLHVDVDQWIDGGLSAFAVQYVEPSGRPGTEIVLEGEVLPKVRVDEGPHGESHGFYGSEKNGLVFKVFH
jgi:3-polyprenyl-4-hydroxybenzoate decarboxylase